MSGAGADRADRYWRQLVRGIQVSFAGLIAKLIHPLLFLEITWLFGPEVVGVYLLAVSIGELASSAVTAGYVDATTIFASRDVDEAARDSAAAARVYDVTGNAFLVCLGVAAALALSALVGSGVLVGWLYPSHPELGAALRVLATSLVPMAFARIAIAATKAHMRMEYDAAILGVLQPVLLLVLSLLAWAVDGGVIGLMWAHLATQITVAIAAGWALARHFDLRRVLIAALRPRLHRPMLRFAVPQALNMTFNRYNTRLDLIMLAAFGFSAVELAIYGTASLITSNIRQIKLVFSTALAPIAVRLHGAGDLEALDRTLSRVTRWTTTLVIPVVALVLVLRDDILRFVDPSYTQVETFFMVVLLVPPFLSCAAGLAGNIITYAGHSQWTLANSLAVGVLNTALNFLLIPPLGLLGAALATALAATGVTMLQLVELRWIEGVALRPRELYQPYLGLIAVSVLVVLLWDPAQFQDPAARATTAGALAIGYFALMVAVGHPEIRAFLRGYVGQA